MLLGYKEKVWDLLELDSYASSFEKWLHRGLIFLIFSSIICAILESIPAIYLAYQIYFDVFETFTISMFTLELIGRIWSCSSDYRYSGPWGRFRYLKNHYTIIDILVIFPYYLPSLIGIDLRILRILRLLRVLKLARYSKSMQTIYRVLKKCREELIMSTVVSIGLLIVAATVMFHIENAAQPDKFSSIPMSMWWAICTLATIGYGDVFPITDLGKFVSGCISLIGIAIFALPAAILGSGFIEVAKEEQKCPHCNKLINP